MEMEESNKTDDSAAAGFRRTRILIVESELDEGAQDCTPIRVWSDEINLSHVGALLKGNREIGGDAMTLPW